MTNCIEPLSFRRLGLTRSELEGKLRRRRVVFLLVLFSFGLITVGVFSLFPRAALTVVGVGFCILFGWFGVDFLRQRKSERAWEIRLAHLACPNCSTPFGEEAARLAHKGVAEQREVKRAEMEGRILSIDNFGVWTIECPHCKSGFSIKPESLEFLVNQ